MSTSNITAAEILEASALGYAAAASALLSSQISQSSTGLPFATDWKAYFTQRVIELAAAVRLGKPELFARRVEWLRLALAARDVDEADLRKALGCLQEALKQELPEMLYPAVAPALHMAQDTLEQATEASPTRLLPSDRYGKLALRYLATCLEGNPDAARDILLEAAADMTPQELFTRILIPAEQEIGALWHVGDVSVAEERLVTETTRQTMTLLAARFAQTPVEGRVMMAASVAGNTHDIGLRVVTELFRLAGWRCLFLGANVPAIEIARAAQSFGVQLVVLNATLLTHLRQIEYSVAEIKRISPDTRVLVGGMAFADSPELWRKLGADAYADKIDIAVSAAESLFAG